MNGNPAYHAIALAAATMMLLPLVWATHTGRLPRRAGPTSRRSRRRRSWGLAAGWAIAPLNAVPRIADAAPPVVAACTMAGGALLLTGLALIATAARIEHAEAAL
ncbi:hypothetical protein ACIRL2_40525 [Embleya sp. NPDC127516]|uniref:hypothetical protein n=1 Tax=Embleya sp. NPDC127516 TaxID=3363990 RepID=UPI003817C298